MNIDIFVNFVDNTLILLGMVVIYYFFESNSKIKPFLKKIFTGLMLSTVIIFVMLNSFQLLEIDNGLMFDTRAVMLSVSGMFFGFIPTLITIITAIIIRTVQGGIGTLTGIFWILVSGALGLTWKHFRLKKLKAKNVTWIELYIFSIIVQIIMILLLFTLPTIYSMEVINEVAFPLLVIHPLGGLLIASLIKHTIKINSVATATKAEQDHYKALFDKNSACLILVNITDGSILYVNDASIKKYGYSLEEFTALKMENLNIQSTENYENDVQEVINNKKVLFHYKHITKFGILFDAEIHTNMITLNNVDFMYLTIIDVSKKTQSEKLFKDADQRLKATLLSVGEGIVVTDEHSRITLANQKALTLIGKDENLERKKLFDEFRIYSNQNNIEFETLYNNCINTKTMFRSDNTYSLLTNDNNTIFIDFTISPINNEHGTNHGAILVIRDITIEKERQEEIRFMSRHDYLTRLYNRYNFETELIRLDTKRQMPISLIIGDINGLKLLNDGFGHLEGDRLIQEIANIFKKATRSEDIVARWGGDEFAILLPQTDRIGAESVTNRIKDLCAKSLYDIITPSVSLGISTKTTFEQDIKDTLTQAEEMMYNNKLEDGPLMREELLKHLLETLNKKVIDNESHSSNTVALVEKYCSFHKRSLNSRTDLILLARYHDIGRISIAEEILNKKEKLTEYEWSKIKTHSEIGSRLVSTIPELQHISKAILHHHENFDGTGYPQGLKGKEIDEKARLLTIIDAYESITHNRVYHESKSHDDAINEILKNTGTQFDPVLVQKFIDIFKR